MVVANTLVESCGIFWNLVDAEEHSSLLRWMYWTWLEWGLLSASVAGKK